jgi:cytochrome c oxidase assembly protein subunit 15
VVYPGHTPGEGIGFDIDPQLVAVVCADLFGIIEEGMEKACRQDHCCSEYGAGITTPAGFVAAGFGQFFLVMASQRDFHVSKIVFLSIAGSGGGKKVPKGFGVTLLTYLCAAMVSSTTSLRSERASSHRAGVSRPVAIWVYTGVIMLLIQVILGGITRLTGSGLSITEWNVVTGAVPPLNTAQWQVEFAKYKATPQYQLLNSGFTLSDFKFIFFWEWSHRFWARLVGVVFVVGFVVLIWKRKMQLWMVRPLIILFLLGALQGAIGWIMVASGLTGDAIYVKPAKLALHFVFALGLIVYTFWFALQLSVPDSARLTAGVDGSAGGSGDGVKVRRLSVLRRWTIVILVLLFFQLLYGALMAGHKAATVAPTWPTINGSWIPGSLFSEKPLMQDLAGNKITVHFIHRGLAYLLLILVGVWSILAARIKVGLGAIRWLPLVLIGVQIILGICSLLMSPGIIPQQWVTFDWLAQFHQITGLLFLLTMVGMLYLVIPVRHTVDTPKTL